MEQPTGTLLEYGLDDEMMRLLNPNLADEADTGSGTDPTTHRALQMGETLARAMWKCPQKGQT